MHGNLPRLPEYGGRGVEVARLVRVGHASSSDARPRHRTSLSIRSAERRRWAADLTGPGRGGLVIYGMGGIGKSTLAAQIATRVSRLHCGRVVTVVNRPAGRLDRQAADHLPPFVL